MKVCVGVYGRSEEQISPALEERSLREQGKGVGEGLGRGIGSRAVCLRWGLLRGALWRSLKREHVESRCRRVFLK